MGTVLLFKMTIGHVQYEKFNHQTLALHTAKVPKQILNISHCHMSMGIHRPWILPSNSAIASASSQVLVAILPPVGLYHPNASSL